MVKAPNVSLLCSDQSTRRRVRGYLARRSTKTIMAARVIDAFTVREWFRGPKVVADTSWELRYMTGSKNSTCSSALDIPPPHHQCSSALNIAPLTPPAEDLASSRAPDGH